MSILVLLHTEVDGSLARPALEAVTVGRRLSSELRLPSAIGLLGADVAAGARQVACAAERVWAVRGAPFAQPRYATDLPAAEAVCRTAGPAIVLLPATSRWMRVAGGLAQRLGGAVDTHVTRVIATGESVSVSRWFYRQRMEATLSRAERPWVIAIEPGTAEPWAGTPGEPDVQALAVELPELRTEVRGVRVPAAGERTVRPDADLLFVAGAGWTKKQPDGQAHVDEAETLILSFLRTSRASLGGSKSLVDQSGEGHAVLPFMTHLNQVGQTGSSPRHRKGLATCCHGEEPHVIGWRFITERRAVNLNPNCGWAQGKADVLYVADAFEVMKKVNELIAGGQ